MTLTHARTKKRQAQVDVSKNIKDKEIFASFLSDEASQRLKFTSQILTRVPCIELVIKFEDDVEKHFNKVKVKRVTQTDYYMPQLFWKI